VTNLYRLKSSNLIPFILVLPSLLILGGILFYPIYIAFHMSLMDISLSTIVSKSGQFIGIKNYIRWLSNPHFYTSLKTTFIYATGVMGGSYILGLITAMLLNNNFKGRFFFRGLIIMPWAIPEVATVLIWTWMFDYQYGVLNYILNSKINWLSNPKISIWSVIFVTIWIQFPLATVILLAGLQTISINIREAARIDGANALQEFLYITLPGLRPIQGILILLLFIYTFKRITIIYLFTGGGPIHSTETLPILTYLEGFKFYRMGSAASVAIIILVIIIIFSIIYFQTLSISKE
jgi:multiple sugar transport system permease protein